MPITRSRYQSSKSLEQYYEEVAVGDHHMAAAGVRMLNVIKLINEMFPETELKAATSLYRLCILSEDSTKLDWCVVISNVVESEYYVEFQLPKSEEPWPQAFVKGTVSGFDNLKKYLIIAMSRTKVWEGNTELGRLIAEVEAQTTTVS